MKKLLTVLFCLLSAFTLFGCKDKDDYEFIDGGKSISPLVTCQNMEEAKKITGFDLDLPDSIDGYDNGTILVIGGEMIEVDYQSNDATITFRKAKGFEDISGDNTQYNNI